MSELVERVAKALAEQQHEPLSDWHREEARAAIRAMREPTESMVDKAMDDDGINMPLARGYDAVWRSMIDEALQ